MGDDEAQAAALPAVVSVSLLADVPECIPAVADMRWRVWGHQSVYANVFYHSPYYHDTTLPALDRRELSLDFGWILRTNQGGEWRLGLTEDLEPAGPGVDLILRLGRVF